MKEITKEYITNLPEYSKNKNCSKCGSHNAKTTWVDHSEGECLERNCSVCGYTWYEKTKDAR